MSMMHTPRLQRYASFANPLAGGNTSGPAKPVPRCFWVASVGAAAWLAGNYIP